MKQEMIKTSPEYEKAMKRTVEIFHAVDSTPETDELDLLLELVRDYEDKNIALPVNIEKYNQELKEAETEYENGQYISHEELIRKIKKWYKTYF